jgi:hypothetical protein
VRNPNEALVTVQPSAAVLPACPSLSAAPAPESVMTASRSIAAAPLGTVALARPKARVDATGVGYGAGWLVTATRRGVERDLPNGTANGKRFSGTTSTKQQDQLHLMSRRDPRTWRPPA